jgi:hypothetical protein
MGLILRVLVNILVLVSKTVPTVLKNHRDQAHRDRLLSTPRTTSFERLPNVPQWTLRDLLQSIPSQ